MSCQFIQRTVEFKLYLNKSQISKIKKWMSVCCWLYNLFLEQRVKAYKRRGEHVKYYAQQSMLSDLRSKIDWIEDVPSEFCRDPLRRVDRGMESFFRRMQAGEHPGHPRFKKSGRYTSLEYIHRQKYVKNKKKRIFIPKIGEVKARGVFGIIGDQRSIKIICKASGWYAQVLYRQPKPAAVANNNEVGIDMGLASFAALDNGEFIENPRLFRKAEKKLASIHRVFSKRKQGSKRKEKAKNKLAMAHEIIARKRRGFCHQESRKIANRFGKVAFEKLSMNDMIRGRYSKSILDAAWIMFIRYTAHKVEETGGVVVLVDPRKTSQECPQCGSVVRKHISERIHLCGRCHYGPINRDVAAAQVVRQRAFRPVRGDGTSPSVSCRETEGSCL